MLDADEGFVQVRPDVPVKAVDKNMSVAKLPEEFRRQRIAFKRTRKQ